MDRLAVGRTLGHQAFAATTADANPVYDVTLLDLVAQPRALCLAEWGGEPGAARTAGGTASSGPSAGSASRPTASSATAPGCTCTRPSWLT